MGQIVDQGAVSLQAPIMLLSKHVTNRMCPKSTLALCGCTSSRLECFGGILQCSGIKYNNVVYHLKRCGKYYCIIVPSPGA